MKLLLCRSDGSVLPNGEIVMDQALCDRYQVWWNEGDGTVNGYFRPVTTDDDGVVLCIAEAT